MTSGSWIVDKVTSNPAAPHFIALSAKSWFRALAIAIDHTGFSQPDLDTFYSTVTPNANRGNQDQACISLVAAVNYYSALKAIQAANLNYDTANASIVIWYYCVYHSSQAMCDSANFPDLQKHAVTANVWTAQLAETSKARYPFSIYITDLSSSNVASELSRFKNGSTSKLDSTPNTYNDAEGALATYLGGTIDYLAVGKKAELKASKEFRDKGWSSFRFKEAAERLEKRLENMRCGFLHMAFRIRGKANYRDHVFLTHNNKLVQLTGLVDDQLKCCRAFFNMAAVYVRKRSRQQDWSDFTADLHRNTNLTLGFPDLYI